MNLIGVSMGGANALSWALQNPARVQGIRVFAPAWDLAYCYDTNSEFRTSLQQTFNVVDRPGFITASRDIDAKRNAAKLALVSGKLTAFAALDDNVVGTSAENGLFEWAEEADIELMTTPTGGHLVWMLGPEYDELDIARAFEA